MKHILSIQSHVVFGYAGNKAATFPMQLLGVDVWALNTVQFSNHTQYGKWGGMVMPEGQIGSIVQGINNIDQLQLCNGVLSGYIGSAQQVQEIIEAVDFVKSKNPNAIYFCDPVMGHPSKGCIVADGVKEALCEIALPKADILSPNLVELRELTGLTVENFDQALQAVQKLLSMGLKIVLVKHLAHAGKDPNSFEMLLATTEGIWHISRSLHQFDREPVGVGDLTAGLFFANYLQGKTPLEAFHHTANAVNDVMEITHNCKQYELQIIASQEKIRNPHSNFMAQKIF